jgi:hypothetical protein
MSIKFSNNFYFKPFPKFIQSGIFGLKIFHLATLLVKLPKESNRRRRTSCCRRPRCSRRTAESGKRSPWQFEPGGQCYNHCTYLTIFDNFGQKMAKIAHIFWRKYFKNNNIGHGAEIMVTICICRVSPIFDEQMALFLKTQCHAPYNRPKLPEFRQLNSSNLSQSLYFSIFRRKYFSTHNIGPGNCQPKDINVQPQSSMPLGK